MSFKTITIITPSLNQGQFIEETILSVLYQAGPFYLDYIIADGGSSDNTIAIIKKYDFLLKKNKFPIKCKGILYRWWSHPDKGQVNAINKGFKLCKGEILSWLNSDDFYKPNTLKTIFLKFKQNYNYDLIYGDCLMLNQSQNTKKIIKARPGNFKQFLTRGHDICQPSAFFTKKIINQVGLLNENMNYAFDYDLWLKILKQSQGLYIPQTLSTFRLWEKSKTISSPKKFLKERQQIFKRYGGNIIDPKVIYKIRAMIPFSKSIKQKFPKIYNLCKNTFYFFIDKIKHNSKHK